MSYITGISNDPTKLHERRRSERKSTAIRVEITHPHFGTIIGSTQDISEGGASVKLDGEIIPPVSTEVSVRFIKMVGTINEEPVKMKVMHVQRNVIGLMFSS